MNESLLLRLFTLSSLCAIISLFLYYLLGYSTLGIVNSIQLIFYTSSGSIAHGYYYFAFQLRDLDFQLIGGCPEKKDLEPIDSTMNTVIIAESCPKITMKPKLQSQIIYTSINGS